MTAAADGPAAFPWTEAMTTGFALLRLSPTQFWAMTPRELAAAMGWLARPPSGPPARGDLEQMIRIFPDGTKTRSGHDR